MKSLKYLLPILMLSTSVNASVITNELDGQQYEWLSLDVTLGQSRDVVEGLLNVASIGDELYGYEYASRLLLSDLFTSYAVWDTTLPDVDGYSTNSDIISGISTLFSDFGATEIQSGSEAIYAYYGFGSECGDTTIITCEARLEQFFNASTGLAEFTYQSKDFGWDPTYSPVRTIDKFGGFDDAEYYSSFLVKQSSPASAPLPSTVPVPAAAWLFGSALLGFFGFSRKKANA